MKKTLILLLLLTNFLFASIGQITALRGEVKISRDSKEILAKVGEELEKNDVINSAKASKAQITLNDNTIITIGQNSTLNIFDYAYDASKPKDSKASFGFMKGSFKSITGSIGKINKERFKLRTKSATIGIRGTTIIGDQNIIACTDGAIRVTAAGISVDVDKQEFTTTPQGQAPTPPEPLKEDTLNTLEQQAGGDEQENTSPSESSSGDNPEDTPPDESSPDDTPPDVLENTPPVDTTPPDVLDDTPPNGPDKPDIPTAPSINSFTYQGYITGGTDNGSGVLTSLVLGEMGAEIDSNGNVTSHAIAGLGDNLTHTAGTLSSSGDKFDSNDDLVYKYGTWDKGDSTKGIWIVGAKTAENVVANYINAVSSQTINFSGTVLGGTLVKNGISKTILNTSTASFGLTLGGGSKSFTSTFTLITSANVNDNRTVNIDGNVSTAGFTPTQTNYYGTSKMNASFAGKDLDAIIGDVQFKDYQDPNQTSLTSEGSFTFAVNRQ